MSAKSVDKVFTVKVYEDGRITIPDSLREAARIGRGDFVTLMFVKNNGKMNQLPKEGS